MPVKRLNVPKKTGVPFSTINS